MRLRVVFPFVIIFVILLFGCPSPLDNGGSDDEESEELLLSDDFDGDGYSNDDELSTYGFDPDSDPYKFNPMVADVPRIRVSLVSAPQITLQVESSESGSTEITTGTESGYRQEVTQSESHSTSTTIETVVSEHRDTVNLGPITLSSPQGTKDTSRTTTEEESFTWSESQSVTNSQKHSEAQSIRQEQGFTYSGGELMVSVEIKNTGHIAYTLSNLTLSAHEYRFFGADTLHPIGNLEFDSTSGEFPETTLGPGDTLGPLVFIKDDLPLDTALSLWNDSRGLVVRPSTYQLTDENNVSFNHHLTTIMARTATVIVDYGPSVDRKTEHHSVATNVDPDSPGITFAEALDEHLYLPYATDADGLISVRGEEGVTADNTEWLVTHLYTEGGQDSYDIYSAQDSVDFDDLVLKAGNVLHLTYMDDSDEDGLYTREELFHGTDPGDPDSDGDGLLDGEEVHGYEVPDVTIGGALIRTDPTKDDTDGDGDSDGAERTAETDPTSLFPVTLDDPDEFDSDKKSTVNDAALDAYGNLYLVGQRNRVSGPRTESTWALRKYAPDGAAYDGWEGHNFVGDVEGEHSAEAVAIGPDGSVYAVGYFTMRDGSTARETWGIKKFHPSGEEITAGWDKALASGTDDARAHAVAVDNSGNVYVAGYSIDLVDDSSGKDWLILKLDPEGNWEKLDEFDDGDRDDVANAVTVDGNGNLIVAGYSTDSGGNRFWRVRKYTSAGTLSWDESFEQTGQDTEAMDVAVDGDNNIYVVGYETVTGGSRWRVKRYSSGGHEDLSWDIDYYRGQGTNEARAVTTDSAGNVYVVGSERGQIDTNWRIIRYTPSGTPGDDWSFDYSDQANISANAVAVGNDGEVYVAGDRNTGHAGGFYWHIRKYYGIVE